jgi:hypothetical protein
MSRPVLAFTAVFAAGLLALLAFATLERRQEAFTLGVTPSGPVEVPAGKTICQGPVDVPTSFQRAVVSLADGTTEDGDVRELRDGRIEVCVTGPATVLGNVGVASRSTSARIDGKPVEMDMAVVFVRAEPRRLLSLVPDVVSRAALFHGGWVKPWLVAVLGALLLTAFPLLLAAALHEIARVE